MIDKKKYIKFIVKLHGNSTLKKQLDPSIKKLNISLLCFEEQLKRIYLHELPRKPFCGIGYKSQFTMYNLLFDDYHDLLLIKNEIKGKGIKHKFLESLFDNKFKQKQSNVLIDSITSFTCEYCQTQLGYSFKGTKRKYYTNFFDHILPKSKYPLFSMSYGNFIISCFSCNSVLKQDKEIKIYNIKKVCPPELFKFKINKNAIINISSKKLNLDDFIIEIDSSSPYFIDFLYLEDRVNQFKKFIRDYIYVQFAISLEHKITAITETLDLNGRTVNRSVVANIYDNISDNELSGLLKSVKTAIDRDIRNLTQDNYL